MGGSLRAALALAFVAVLVVPVGVAFAEPETSRRYANPVAAAAADTFADPAVIRGKDGFWYAFGTGDPLWEGEHAKHLIPILRSPDLVRWEHVADVFTAANRPAWVAADAGFWAPDVRYADGRYLVYFTVTDTILNAGGDSAIGVATAPAPTGPWTELGAPIVPPAPGEHGGFRWTFDPAMIIDTEGGRWLYYGSYYGGLFVVPLSADGLRRTGPPTRIAIADRYEGGYVVRRGGWYYLFGSAANCCAGPATGYSVFAARSRTPTGPFVDRDGLSLLDSRVGGTPVIQPNGNRWIGTGHNSVVTDAAGQDWLAYHAIDRADPYLDEPYGEVERPMLLDRLDWIDEWPVVRAGAGASTGGQRAPVAGGSVDDRFERDALGPGWRAPAPGWRVVARADPDSGGLVRHFPAGTDRLVSTRPVPADVHVELDVRVPGADSAAGVVAGGVAVTVDRRAAALVTGAGGVVRRTPLPADFRYDTWHSISVHLRDSVLDAAVTDARLGDPIAEQTRVVPRRAGEFAVTARGVSEVDNVSAAHAARPVRTAEPPPRVGRLDPAASDEFDGGNTGGWTWIRPDPAAKVESGALRWPTQAADLVGAGNDASVLLRDPPRGEYVVETRLELDLGENTARNFEQAGLIAYAGDDDFARLSQVALWNTRQLEYGRELPFAGRLAFGGMALTAPAVTTWLRLAHTVDPASGEHRFRGAASRDGEHWTWGGTWTFPPGPAPRVGLVAHGGNVPPVTAAFDYFRIHRP
ncbi:family 43 glycosylhydrolase [Amycolatopsis anabasis]|uniref:family 43 glycosylhydrolase n=1 Tax=Amycolatopsis anabasis TaxID=1840409 RepID=UPI00131B8853|nr:family 43 glycosylhydrolase [Amycolatopsis anabasis]